VGPGDTWKNPIVIDLDPTFCQTEGVRNDKTGLSWRVRGADPPSLASTREFEGAHWLSLRGRDAPSARNHPRETSPRPILIDKERGNKEIERYIREGIYAPVWRRTQGFLGTPGPMVGHRAGCRGGSGFKGGWSEQGS
jgi:hypothetical protein